MQRFLSAVLPPLGFLLLLSLVLFLAFLWLPGDISTTIFHTSADAESLSALRASLNLDQPFWTRYVAWLQSFVVGDWGTSMLYGTSVRAIIFERLPLSLSLAATSFFFALLCGVPLGLFLSSGARGRKIVSVAIQTLLAVPSFLLSILLLFVFVLSLGILPSGGTAEEDHIVAHLRHILLPATALALPQIAILARFTESSLDSTLGATFVVLARAKGASRARILFRHALRVAAAPILTLNGLQFAFLLSGTVVVETVFALPGLGRLFLSAALARDVPLALALTMVFACATLLANSLSEWGARVLDPRIQEAYP